MDAHRFDRFTTAIAGRQSRRTVLKHSGMGLGVAALGAAGLTRAVAAQGATPSGSASPAASPTDIGENGAFLFVQTAQSGTWAPKAGKDGVYTLTLHEITDQTVYFSDRPQRIVGVAPMQQFLDGLGFAPQNPPNAALVAHTAAGEDVLVIELLKPVYDAAAGTLTYDARVLENYEGTGLAFLAQQQNDDKMEATFTDASLFIDDCPDETISCYGDVNQTYLVGKVEVGCCYSFPACFECRDYSNVCADQFPGTVQNSGGCKF